jgi:hypothetical protein
MTVLMLLDITVKYLILSSPSFSYCRPLGVTEEDIWLLKQNHNSALYLSM